MHWTYDWMVCGVKLRRVMSSIMRRRKGVMCGSFASERWEVSNNPFTMPHRSREGAYHNPRHERREHAGQSARSTLGQRKAEEIAGANSGRAVARSCPPRSGLVQPQRVADGAQVGVVSPEPSCPLEPSRSARVTSSRAHAAQFNGLVSDRPALAWKMAMACVGPPDTTFFILPYPHDRALLRARGGGCRGRGPQNPDPRGDVEKPTMRITPRHHSALDGGRCSRSHKGCRQNG